MLARAFVVVPVVLAFVLFPGCEPPKKTTSGPAETNAPSDNAASTPIVPIVPTLPVPTPSLTLEAAHQLQLAPIKRLIALFDSVQDEASAQAAAPKIAQDGRALGEGMKAFVDLYRRTIVAKPRGRDRVSEHAEGFGEGWSGFHLYDGAALVALYQSSARRVPA